MPLVSSRPRVTAGTLVAVLLWTLQGTFRLTIWCLSIGWLLRWFWWLLRPWCSVGTIVLRHTNGLAVPSKVSVFRRTLHLVVVIFSRWPSPRWMCPTVAVAALLGISPPLDKLGGSELV
jgi:hypothetical protein